jgi:metal-sulfur cluster biosynthetic enzyme
VTDPDYYIAARAWEPLAALPQAWGHWQEGWGFFKRLDLKNATSLERPNEPIEVDVEFHTRQVSDLAREIRVVEVETDNGPLREIPSQVYGDEAEDETRRCRLFFIAALRPEQTKTYLIFYGNPAAPHPNYETDLKVHGEEYALDVENTFYYIVLAKSMGQLQSITFKEGDITLDKGAGMPYCGHGVEGSIHHNPDWSDEYTGRYRITSWERPPHYEVIRGPVCLRLKRWGHPILSIGPGVGRSHKVVASITYSFYAAVPYVVMESRLEVLQDVRFGDCRNDEWVGICRDMPDVAWRMADEEIGFGLKSWSRQDPAWLTVFNKESGHGFASIRMDYQCTHPNWQHPATVALSNQWGGLWVRYPLHNTLMRAGDLIYEKNAYLLHQYAPPRQSGFGMLVDYAARLADPPIQEEAAQSPKPLNVDNVIDALGWCADTELYIRGGPTTKRILSYVDLGWVRDVKIDGDAVYITLVLPYTGRQNSFGWFVENMAQRIRERIEGVGEVTVKQVHEPKWEQNQLTQKAQRILGMTAADDCATSPN